MRRWQEFTGKQATLDGDRRTFEQIAEERVGRWREATDASLDGPSAETGRVQARVDAAPSWYDYFAEAEKLARSMLSPAERNLVAETSARWKERGSRVPEELPPPVWEQFRPGTERIASKFQACIRK